MGLRRLVNWQTQTRCPVCGQSAGAWYRDSWWICIANPAHQGVYLNGEARKPITGLADAIAGDELGAELLAATEDIQPAIADEARERFLELGYGFSVGMQVSRAALGFAETWAEHPDPSNREVAVYYAGVLAGYLWRVCERTDDAHRMRNDELERLLDEQAVQSPAKPELVTVTLTVVNYVSNDAHLHYYSPGGLISGEPFLTTALEWITDTVPALQHIPADQAHALLELGIALRDAEILRAGLGTDPITVRLWQAGP